jgi:hypothetical protein
MHLNNNKIIKTMNRIQISLYKLILNTENLSDIKNNNKV